MWKAELNCKRKKKTPARLVEGGVVGERVPLAGDIDMVEGDPLPARQNKIKTHSYSCKVVRFGTDKKKGCKVWQSTSRACRKS